MKQETIALCEATFPKEEIFQQVQRIFLDPLFINSDILRRFLLFIVDQTLSGHSNWLKEYTIGVNVLNKPSNFKPQENGVVRIHAGRLRRALNHYYNDIGVQDPIRINVPLGSYVPVFIANSIHQNTTVHNNAEQSLNPNKHDAKDKPEVIALVPFRHHHNNKLENSFAEGLGLQLNSALMRFEKYSVLGYYTVCHISEKLTDINELAAFIGAKYIFTGNIQTHDNRVRIQVQLIDASSNEQVWNWMHESKITAGNIFELQDEVVKLVIAEISKTRMFSDSKLKKIPMIAVA